jgi:hypothetical protein
MSELNGFHGGVAKKKQRRLSMAAAVDITQWLNERKAKGEAVSLRDVMVYAKGKGFNACEETVLAIAGQIGVELTRRRRRRNPNEKVPRYHRALGYCLRSLYEKLGEPVPPLLNAVIRGGPIEHFTVADAYAKEETPEGTLPHPTV